MLFVISILSILLTSHACPSGCRCSFTMVDCSYQNLTYFPTSIPWTTLTLLLHHNQITDLNNGYFGRGSSLILLRVLDLRHNNIITLRDFAFENLHNLKILKLDYNQIEFHSSAIRDPFSGTERYLEVLTVSHNKLSGAMTEYSYGHHSALTHLDLSYNQYSVVSIHAPPPYLEYLDLSYNKISDIHPRAFQDLLDLQHLDLRGLAMTRLTAILFKNMRILKELKIGGEELTSLTPAVFDGLDSLTKLEISGSVMDSFPNRLLRPCPKLEKLNFTDNRLTSLPRVFFADLSFLQEVDLSRNLIQDGDYLASALATSRVKYLDLSSNKVETLVSKLPSLPGLRSLNLENNGVASLGGSFVSDSLQELNLASNLISRISADVFTSCTALQKVNLTSNNLSVLPNINTSSERPLAVYINNNPWNCNCDFIDSYRRLVAMTSSQPLACENIQNLSCITCASPVTLKGVAATDVMSRNPVCDDTIIITGPNYDGAGLKSEGLIAIVVAAIIVLILLAALLVWCQRGKIKTLLKKKEGHSPVEDSVSHIYAAIDVSENEYGTIESRVVGNFPYALATESNIHQYEVAGPAYDRINYTFASNHVQPIVPTITFDLVTENGLDSQNVYLTPEVSSLSSHCKSPVKLQELKVNESYILPDMLPTTTALSSKNTSPAVMTLDSGYIELNSADGKS